MFSVGYAADVGMRGRVRGKTESVAGFRRKEVSSQLCHSAAHVSTDTSFRCPIIPEFKLCLSFLTGLPL